MPDHHVTPADAPRVLSATLLLAVLAAAAGALFATAPLAAAQERPAPPAGAKAQPGTPPAIRVARLTAPPALDPFLAGSPPPEMTVVTGFVQREPRDGEPVSRETTAYLGYDDRNFYAVFVCRESAGAIRAHMARREGISGDDVVGLMLDTFHDRRHAYLFLVNPLGIQLDGIATEGQDDDYSFDTLWYSEGRITPDGYVASMTIPFRSLRFRSSDVQEWGIGLGRIIPTRNETSFWPYITRKQQALLGQMATLRGIERVSPGRNIQLIPYTAAASSRYLDEQAAARDNSTEGRVGLDAKVVIKDAMTLDLALNPDFSQVESDEPQVTVNQRFEVLFPEKRPFFIENASYFSTNETLFFSRRIADPRFGARLTGRVGKWNVAGVVMDDRTPGDLASEASGARGDATVAAVGRVVREFGRQSTVGAMVTSRDFAASSNRVASGDLVWRVGRNWTLSGQAMTSATRSLDGRKESGPAYYGEASYSSRTLNIYSAYRDRSPRFRSELGFIPRNDIRMWDNEVAYTFFPKKSNVLLSWQPSVETSVNWDRAGRLQDWRVNPEIEFDFPSNTELFIGTDRSYELYNGIGFRKRNLFGSIGTEWLKWLSASVGIHNGRGINYYPASGLRPFLSHEMEVEGGLTFRPAPGLRIEQAYIHNRLKTGPELPDGIADDASVFRLHLLRTKANYQFTRELSLRAIVDYSALTPNPTLVALDRDRRLTADVLVTYLVNPGTALYVGYTDAYANVRIDPTLPPSLVRTDGARTSVGRQVFVKLSYLFRY